MWRSLVLVMLLSSCASTAQPSKVRAPERASFDPEEIRAAERGVIAALESSDPTAWVYRYTEDALLVESGEVVSGRPALLEMARAIKLSSVVIRAERTEGDEHLAYVVATAAWVSGAAATTTHVRALMIWRKEADGNWRIAYEALTPEPPAK